MPLILSLAAGDDSMSFLDRLLDSSPAALTPIDPSWQRNAQMKYMTLFSVACRPAALQGKGGVFIVWANGKSGWIYCGYHDNMFEAVDLLANSGQVLAWSKRDTLVFSWSPIREDCCSGVVKYLRSVLSFKVVDAELDVIFKMDSGAIDRATPIAVLPPG